MSHVTISSHFDNCSTFSTTSSASRFVAKRLFSNRLLPIGFGDHLLQSLHGKCHLEAKPTFEISLDCLSTN